MIDNKTIKSNEYMMLEDYISHGVVKTHRTKKDAQVYAKSIGWQQYNVIKVERRFETVWLVGYTHIQNDILAGMEFSVYKLPTGNYEYKNGSQQMIMVEVKKYIEKKTANII